MIERRNEFKQGAIAAVLSAAALAGSLYVSKALDYRNVFIPGTVINGENAAERTVSEGLSVRQIEKLAQESGKPGTKRKPRKTKSADEKRVEMELREALGTKVSLQRKGARGKIEIEFYNGEEMERLIDLLRSIR